MMSIAASPMKSLRTLSLAAVTLLQASVLWAQPSAQTARSAAGASGGMAANEMSQPRKDNKVMSNEIRSATGEAEIAAAKGLTTKVLAIGKWTAKATPEARPKIMPSEARDTMRLQLAGKIDQWYAKSDGSGAVFLMNVTDPAEAHRLLEDLPLGRADMMTFDIIPMGPLWPMGLLLREPAN
jgi:hypothetical protein